MADGKFGFKSSRDQGFKCQASRELKFARTRVRVFIAAILGSVALLSGGVRGEAFSRYQNIGTFALPAGSVMFDALPDGRVITLSGSTVYVETEPASGSFAPAGNLAGSDFPSFGAAFLRVSPDGTRFAVGNNGGSSFSTFRVGVFNVSNLSGSWFAAAHYDAAWVDDHRLAITAGDFGSPAYVTVLDTNSPNPLAPNNRTIIAGIGGSSGGIALDAQGNLFTGNGFAGDGPSGTGAIKVFSSSSWEGAYAGGGAPLNFETQGTLVADVLSASPLDFDAEGNLLVGGGDFSATSEIDFVALVRAATIASALAGQGLANTNDPSQVRKLDADAANDFNFFFTVSNRSMGRFYSKDVAGTKVYTYGVPSPFATQVLAYAPAPGQFVNDAGFNNSENALGPPAGGGTNDPNNESVVTLGAFGGFLVLGFDHTILDDSLNPFGLDAIVFSNAYWVGGPHSHWAECATIEISMDINANGLADDAWYLIPGSHIAPGPVANSSVTWDQNLADSTYPPFSPPAANDWFLPGMPGQWATYGYRLPEEPFEDFTIVNPKANGEIEEIYGYAEYSPTLLLGDTDGDDIIDDYQIAEADFYTVPDDPFEVGISPRSGGGDAFDIAWAVDAETGQPAYLEGFDFIRLTTAVDLIAVPIGEKSAEIDAVADVAPDSLGDADSDGDIDLRDFAAVQSCNGLPIDASVECQRVALFETGFVGLSDAAMLIERMTGPQ